MSKCEICGSYAINHHCHGRDGADGDLCDVCYWRKRAEQKPLTDGWKLVPVEPTREMMQAWVTEVTQKNAWAAMIAAAPQPPALGRPQSNPTPYLYYDPENGDTWTQEAINDACCLPDGLIALYTKETK